MSKTKLFLRIICIQV